MLETIIFMDKWGYKVLRCTVRN
ncbi:unnamed protein product [Debaryomyces tyrocola]|nr:unnamed protein product [Debaryomyces tyrocola]